MFPNKVYVMDHGKHKDANDFLQAGDQSAYKKAWWAARKVKIENLNVSTEDYLDLYEESPDFEYFETGIPDLDSKILGICKGYFTVLLAQTGVGKTELLRYLEYQCLTKSDYKFAFMHLEESKLRSVLGLVSYDLNENLILPKYIAEKGMDKEVRESIGNLTKDERMIQFNYSPDDGYESLIDQVKFLKAAFDVDYVFFEPIQDLVNGSDKESKLADLSTRLGTLCSEIDVGIVTIAHQNKDGDTMYASMIGKKAAFEILLDRDQESDDINIRNTTNVRVGRKNRVGNGNGPAGQLEFNSESYTLVPVVHDMTHTSRDDSDGIPF
jgi:replicative DNA helicase